MTKTSPTSRVAVGSNELVSVVVPCFNHEKFIGEFLESLLQQTWARLELILVDDGSSDNSVKVVESFRQRIEARVERFFFRSRENRGLSATQNELLGIARGDYFLFSASDDRLKPRLIETLLGELRREPAAALACADCTFIDEGGHAVRLDQSGTPVPLETSEGSLTFLEHALRERPGILTDGSFGAHHTLLSGNYIPVAPLLRARLANRALPYPRGLVLDDLYFWLKLSQHGNFILVREPLSEYRVHSTSVSRTRQTRMREDHLRILLTQRDYCLLTHHEDEWIGAMEALISLRKPQELLHGLLAGVNPVHFAARRSVAHLRRIVGRYRNFAP